MSTIYPSLSLHITEYRNNHVHRLSITITTHHSAPPSCPLDVHHYHYTSQCTTTMSTGCPSLSLHIIVHHHHVHWMSITITTHHSAPPSCPLDVHHYHYSSQCTTIMSTGCPSLSLLIIVHHHCVHRLSITLNSLHTKTHLCGLQSCAICQCGEAAQPNNHLLILSCWYNAPSLLIPSCWYNATSQIKLQCTPLP